MYTKLNINELLIALSIRLFRGLSSSILNRMPKLSNDILKSYMNITPEALISIALLITLITLPVSVFSIYIFIMYNNMMALLLIPIPLIVFMVCINAPKFSMSNRKAALEDELPYLIGYIAILAGGGITLPFALERMSQNKLLPASAKEAKHMFMQIRLLGMNPISALENMSKYNPHDSLADFIGGYVTTLKSGGDVIGYLIAKLKDAYNYRSLRLKSLIEFTGNLAEAYMGIVVVLGLVLLVMFTSQGLISGSGSFDLSNDSIMQSFMFSSVLIPIISIVFIGILHISQPREPFSYHKPYILFLVFLPFLPILIFLPEIFELLPIERSLFYMISNNILTFTSFLDNISIDSIVNYIIDILFFLKLDYISIDGTILEPLTNELRLIANNINMIDKTILSSIPLHIRISVGLILSVLPASIAEVRHSMQKKAVESRLPHFLRDLAEISKNSVSIERALYQLTDRDYGTLTRYIKTMSAQISWGFPIDRILTRFSDGAKSWFSKMIAFILLEIMNVGGGKTETLSNLAAFVERISQLEKEKNSSLRLYGIIPYFGAIISILTLVIMLDVFMNPLGNFENRLTISEENKSLLLTGSIIQSFTTGIVAGKMGEGSVAAGFKHALILTIISLMSIFIAPLLMTTFDI